MSEKKNAPAEVDGGAHGDETAAAQYSGARHAPVSSELRNRAAGYAVLVEHPAGKYRRRLFLTLASAQRAKDRANERGQYAAIVLVQITPVTGTSIPRKAVEDGRE